MSKKVLIFILSYSDLYTWDWPYYGWKLFIQVHQCKNWELTYNHPGKQSNQRTSTHGMDCIDRFCWLFFLSLICVFCHLFGLVSAIKSPSGLLFLFSTYSIEVTCGLSFYLFFLSRWSTGNTRSCWDMMCNVLVNKCAWSTHQGLAITVPEGATLLCTLQLMGWSDVHYNKLMIPIKLAWTSLGRFIMLHCSACLLKCKRNGECQRLLIYP